MPEFNLRVHKKDVSSLVVGELFLADFGTNETVKCFAFQQLLNEGMLRVVLLEEYREFSAFSFAEVERDVQCISYGTDWLLEVPLDASYHFDLEKQVQPGALSLTGEGLALCISSDDNRRVNSLLKLTDFRMVQISQNHATISGWRIWLNDSHRTTPNAVPLINSV